VARRESRLAEELETREQAEAALREEQEIR